MILRYGQTDDGSQTAASTAAFPLACADREHVNILPFVFAGVLSGLTVWFITRWLSSGGGK